MVVGTLGAVHRRPLHKREAGETGTFALYINAEAARIYILRSSSKDGARVWALTLNTRVDLVGEEVLDAPE